MRLNQWKSAELDEILTLLADAYCRRILKRTSEPMTALELSYATEIPRSTLYRKLDELEETGLIDTRRKFRENGDHPKEYVRSIDEFQVEIDEEGFTVDFNTQSDSTIGGSTERPSLDEDHHPDLTDLFVSVTGETTLVHSQYEQLSRSSETREASEIHAFDENIIIAREDGLQDVIDDLNR